MDNPSNPMNSKKVATIVVLSALSIGTNYAMLFLFNVKFMDLIVFVAGFCFGPFVGGLIGILSWAVYGTLNPLGFSLPIWLSTMFSEAIYGVGGGYVKKLLGSNGSTRVTSNKVYFCVFFGALGMFLTFCYDFITNMVFGYVNNMNILVALIVGFVPFGFIHTLSNAFFFGIGGVPAINTILRVVGGENSVVYKE